MSKSSQPQKVLSLLKNGLSRAREIYLYARHKLTGTSYAQYYADRQNGIVKRNPSWGLNLNKSFQLDYLKRQGLAPSARILDYGCGALAAGVLFVGFLEAKGYTGVDISEAALAEGKRRLEKSGLTHKAPALLHLTAIDLDVLSGQYFDFIWAQSVFTHMPPDDIRCLLPQIRALMRRDSVFFASFAYDPKGPRQHQFKDWYYDPAFFEALASDCGMTAAVMEDWIHPDDAGGNDRLLCFRIAS